MFYKKPGLPEEGELVLCTVKKILSHSVFVSIDEYKNLEGIINIAEISPGRIRNLRDFVKEGKRIVCKVLRIKGKEVELSLRRVSEKAKAEKLSQHKLEVKAEKLLEFVGKKFGISLEEMYKKFGYDVIEKYGSLPEYFYKVLENENLIQETKLNKQQTEELLKVIKENFKLPEVEIKGTLMLSCAKENGIEIIKEALLQIKDEHVMLRYVSAPRYEIVVKSKDFKDAENILKQAVEKISSFVISNGGTAEFVRQQ